MCNMPHCVLFKIMCSIAIEAEFLRRQRDLLDRHLRASADSNISATRFVDLRNTDKC